jgi:hypothetical protein
MSRTTIKNVRDQIHKSKTQDVQEAIARLKAELAVAFDQPDDSYVQLRTNDVIARNQTRT